MSENNGLLMDIKFDHEKGQVVLEAGDGDLNGTIITISLAKTIKGNTGRYPLNDAMFKKFNRMLAILDEDEGEVESGEE